MSFLKISKPLKLLYLTQLVRQFGVALLDFFGVMFVYEVSGERLSLTILVFLVLYGLYGLLVPLVARFYGKFTRRQMLVGSMVVLALSYMPFVLIPDKLWWVIVLHVFGQLLFRLFYWLPYQVTVSSFMKEGERGRVMGRLYVLSALVVGISPWLGGWLIDKFSFSHMFVVGILTLLISAWPLYYLPKFVNDRFVYNYRQTFKVLFHPKNRRLLLANAGSGADHVSRVVIWPLVIYFLLSGEYSTLGLLSTLAMILVVLLRLVTGHFLDAPKTKEKVIHITTKFQALAWIGRVFPTSPFQVFLADTFYRSVESANTLSYEKTIYDHTEASQDYADEYIVVRTVALGIGRVCLLLVALLLGLTYGLEWVFLFSALASLLMNRVQKEEFIK